VINLSKVVGGQLNRSGTEVLLESMTLRRSRNRHNPGLLREQPCERDLRWRRLLLLRSARRDVPESAGRGSPERELQQLVGRAPISAAEFAHRHVAAFTPA
jgi:hypothetical protein